MSITVLRTGDNLKVMSASAQIPEDEPIVMYTEDELDHLATSRCGWLDMQMPSFIRGDEDERAEDLF